MGALQKNKKISDTLFANVNSMSLNTPHTMPNLSFPHTALLNQPIKLDKRVRNKLGLEFPVVSDFVFDNEQEWLSFLAFSLKNNFCRNNLAEKILNTTSEVELEKLQDTLVSTTMDKLGNKLLDHQKNIIESVVTFGIGLADHLLAYMKNQFSHTLTFSNEPEIYGENTTLGLRIDAKAELTVITNDTLCYTLEPIKNIGSVLIRLLAETAEKGLTNYLVNYYNDFYEFNEVLDNLSAKEESDFLKLLLGDYSNEDVRAFLMKCENINENMINDIESEMDLETFSYQIKSTLESNDAYSFLDYCSCIERQHDEAIAQVEDDISRIKNSNNPLVAHPLFIHYCNILEAFKANYIPLTKNKSDLLSSGSDRPIEEFSLISLNEYIDSEMFDMHNENIMESGETGSYILDLDSDDVMPYLYNHILADILLVGFDI